MLLWIVCYLNVADLCNMNIHLKKKFDMIEKWYWGIDISINQIHPW